MIMKCFISFTDPFKITLSVSRFLLYIHVHTHFHSVTIFETHRD